MFTVVARNSQRRKTRDQMALLGCLQCNSAKTHHPGFVAAHGQVQLGPERVVPLASFRGAARPVVLAGSQGYISRALKAAELFRTELRARGVSVVPLALTANDPGEKLAALKREFGCAC